jgi:hypothetical protein
MAEAPSSNSTSLPSSTSILLANFIPRRLQLQSSLPTSSLVTNFNPRHLSISKPIAFLFPPLLLDARGVLDAAATR